MIVRVALMFIGRLLFWDVLIPPKMFQFCKAALDCFLYRPSLTFARI